MRVHTEPPLGVGDQPAAARGAGDHFEPVGETNFTDPGEANSIMLIC